MHFIWRLPGKLISSETTLWGPLLALPLAHIQSNLINMDTEGAIESVRIKLAEIRETVMALFAQGQSKLSVIQWNPALRPPR